MEKTGIILLLYWNSSNGYYLKKKKKKSYSLFSIGLMEEEVGDVTVENHDS